MLNHWVTCESVVSLSRTVQSWDVISSCNWHFNNLGGNHHQSSDDDFHSDCWKSQSLDSDYNFHSGCWKVKRLLKGQKVSYLTCQLLNDLCSDCPKVSHLTLMMTSRKHHFRYCLSISNLNRSQNQERTKQKIFLKYTGKHLGNSTLLLRTSDRTSSLQNSVSSSINNFF